MAVAIYRGPNRGYSLDYDDVLWLARALGGEAKQNDKIAAWHAWSWMDRFMLWRYSDQNFDHFWELIRAHSKVVNPLWMKPGEKKCAEHPGDCEPKDIQRREYWCGRTEDQLREMGLWDLAVKFQYGKLARPVDEPIPDFAADWLVKKQGRPCSDYYCVGLTENKQCFLPLRCLFDDERAAIIDGEVVLGTPLSTLALTVGGLVLAAAVGYGVYSLFRR